jgi:urease accessory protein
MSSRYAITHRALAHRRAGDWPTERVAGTLTLDFHGRHRRRIRLITDQRLEVLLDLPRPVAMADGDGLELDNGLWLVIRAASEPVVEIAHDDPSQLVRLAWHLGNRHLPTEIRGQVLRIRPDHVIEGLLRGFGARLVEMETIFQPEGGAYGGGHHHHGDGGDSDDDDER